MEVLPLELDGEAWKSVPGYEDFYEVSNKGRVRSNHGISKRVLKTWLARGYPSVALSLRDRVRKFQVHTLVLLAFVGPRPQGTEACHNDGDKLNPHLENLRWDSRSANILDRVSHGTHARGERHGVSKLTEDQVRDIRRRLRQGELGNSIAKRYNVDPGHISLIRHRKIWAHVEDKDYFRT